MNYIMVLAKTSFLVNEKVVVLLEMCWLKMTSGKLVFMFMSVNQSTLPFCFIIKHTIIDAPQIHFV